MKSVAFLCLSLAVLGTNAGAPEASFIDPCHYDDSECLLKSSQKAMLHILDGFPEYDIPSFNPLVMKNVRGDSGDLKLYFKNLIVTTLAKCKIIKVVRSEKLKLEVELRCPIIIIGNYTADGKLGPLDIIGDGGFKFSSDDVSITVSAVLKVITKDGQEYYKITGFDFKYEALEKVRFELDNLFNGDKAKAGPILEFLDKFWKEITDSLGGPIIKEMIKEVVHPVGKLFLNTPCNKLELD